MKSPVVFWGSNMPSSTASKKPPEAAKPGSGSGQRIKSWEFDFSTEVQTKKDESCVAVPVEDDDDDDVDVIPPTQDIDDDDDEDDDEGRQNSAGTSPILSAVPEPSFKRLKLNMDEGRYYMNSFSPNHF